MGVFGQERFANDGLVDAQELTVTTAEFCSTNIVKRSDQTRPGFTFPKPSGNPYKAVVNIMLNGGGDSFNMLVPYLCTKEGKKDLEAEYKFIRQKVGEFYFLFK